MAKAGTAYVEVVGDFSKLKRQLAQQMAGRESLHIGVDFDDRSAGSFNRELDKTNRNLTNTTRSANSAGGGVNALSKSFKRAAPNLVGFTSRLPVAQLAVMGVAGYNAAGGVIALTGALAPLTGMLGAVGPLATSAAQAISTIKLATAGVGDAISSAFAEQDQAAGSAATSLQAMEAAAEGVRQAQLSLSAAHRTAKDAQESLTLARADATREIDDMKAAVRSLALEEEGASLSLKEAKQAFAELAESGAGELEIERASLRIREAREELRKTREESRRTSKDLGTVEAGGGVKGMPQVVAARRSLADANRGVVEAEKQVALAIRQSAQAMQATSGAADTLKSKMDALSPPARRFAEFIIGLRPQLKRLQGIAAKGLFPGVQKGITSAMKNLPVLEGIIARTSKALGDLAERAGRRLGSQEWGKDLEVQGKRNEVTITRLGRAGLNLAEAFKDVTLAAGPLVSRLTKWILALTEGWKQSANASRESGRLQRFFKDAGDTFFKTVRILRDLGVAFKNIGSAARQAFGNELLGNIAKGARNLREWTGSVRGQQELVSVFEDIGDNLKAVGRFVRDLVGDFRAMKREGMTTGEALGHIFTDVFVGAITEALEAGPKIAAALVRGFVNADALGKLFGAAFLISKFGGFAAWQAIFRKIGLSSGAAMGQGVVAGAGPAIVGTGARGGLGGALGKLSPRMRAIGKGVLGGALVAGLGAAMTDSRKGLLDRAQDLASILTLGIIPKTKDISERLNDSIKGALTGGELGKGGFGAQVGFDKFLDSLDDKLPAAEKKIVGRFVDLRRRLVDVFGDKAKFKLDVLADPGAALRAFDKLEVGMNRLKNRLAGDAKGIVDVTRNNLKLLPQIMDLHSRAGQRAISKNMKLASQAIVASMRMGSSSTKQGMRAIRTAFVVNSQAAKETTQKNFGLASKAIDAAVQAGLITSRQGLREIRKLFFSYLAQFGIKGRDAEIYMRSVPKSSGGGGKPPPVNKARGGLVQFGQPGAAGRDNIPVQFGQQQVAVGSGEVGAVFNRHQLPILNARLSDMGGLPGFFQKFDRKHSYAQGGFVDRAKRFASGGIVGMMAAARRLEKASFPYLWGGGHQATPAPFGPMDCSGAVSYVLQHGGVKIPTMVSGALASAGQPGPGAVTVFANPGHTFMRIGKDYFGTSGTNPGGGAGFFPDPGAGYRANFTQRHFVGGAADFGTAQQIGKFLVGGPDSPLKAGVQAGLNAARATSNDALENAMVAPIGSGDVGDPGPGGYSKSKLMALWVKAGGPSGIANLAAAVALAESGGQPGASNSNNNGSTDRGLWQINSIHGNLSTFDPLDNAKAAVQISSRGSNWNPWVAFTTGKHRQFLERGGPVGSLMEMFTQGGPVGFGGGKDKGRLPKLKGTLSQKTRQTVKALAASKDKARRAKILKRYAKALKKYGLPNKLLSEISFLGAAHERYADLAESATLLNVDNDDDTVTLGSIAGDNVAGWLTKDLGAMFSMRNKLVKARDIVTRNQKKVQSTLGFVNEQLKNLSKDGKTPAKWEGVNPAKDSVEKWNKQPGPKRHKRMKAWRDKHGKLPGTREFNTFTGKIKETPKSRIPALEKVRGKLRNQNTELIGAISPGATDGPSILPQLEGLQGQGPQGILKSPWPIGTIFGGDILQTQLDIAELFKVPPKTTDDTKSDDSRVALLEQQHIEDLLRLAVSERSFDVLRNFPPFGGQFETGGVVPGPAGAPRTVIAHGGETITPPGKDSNLRVVIEDNRVRVFKDDVEQIVQQVTRRQARSGGRVLPGRAGGN